jgi:UDP-N-acetylglucosamine 4,6-dehydratase
VNEWGGWQGLTVAVTGITGSFGDAFARYALSELDVAEVRGLSRSESRQALMRARIPDPRLCLLLGDVRDADRLEQAFSGADVVIHAAALKRVDASAYDPGESIRTNVLGAINVEAAARRCGVSRVFGISTDKSAMPANLYGATKLLMEHYFAFANHYSGKRTLLATSRYGNVLASNGSVLTLWRRQIERGEPLTVTDPRMTRFLLTLDQAVRFVARCVAEMRGGEVFVPKLPRARITDLAEAYAPGYPVALSTIRPGGEKLAEDLVTAHDAQRTYDRGWCYVVEPDLYAWDGGRSFVGAPVGEGFSVRSDQAPLATVRDLRELLSEAGWVTQAVAA